MDNLKAEKPEQSSKPTSFLSQDMTVIWMAEQKPDSNESRRVSNPNADGNRTEAGVMESRPENEAHLSMDRAASSKKSVHWSPELESGNSFVQSPDGSKVYISRSSAAAPPSSVNFQETVSNVRSVLGTWGKKVGEASKTAADLAGNTWQHLKTSPSFTEAALGRIAQGTKLIAEGGYEKIFRQTFETMPEENLINAFACYLSTSAGPVMGVLYVSTAKFAYCSDNPLPYEFGDQTEWSYYKATVYTIGSCYYIMLEFDVPEEIGAFQFLEFSQVVIPLRQIKAVVPSSSRVSGVDQKYIQVISLDKHEFWFMGFLNYDGAVKCLEGASQGTLP